MPQRINVNGNRNTQYSSIVFNKRRRMGDNNGACKNKANKVQRIRSAENGIVEGTGGGAEWILPRTEWQNFSYVI